LSESEFPVRRTLGLNLGLVLGSHGMFFSLGKGQYKEHWKIKNDVKSVRRKDDKRREDDYDLLD